MNKIIGLGILILLITSCKSPEARRPVSVKTGSFIDTSIARDKELNEREKARILEIIAQNPERDYLTSESGFWYYYNTKVESDSLLKPDFGDIVNFDYNVKTLNNNVIYSKQDLGTQHYAMDQAELFSGLREGLKLMKAGETVTFMFPSQKAFGYYGDEGKIGSSIPLICEVNINSITKNQANLNLK
jgi:gliding motility-associated peptidyl-prolyl isomerase